MTALVNVCCAISHIRWGEKIRGSEPSKREALALDQQKLLRIKKHKERANKTKKPEGGKRAQPQCSRARGSTVRDVHYIKKTNKKSKKHKDDRRTRPWGRGECMLGHVLQGLLCSHTRLKQRADTRKKREPPTHTQQNKQTTQPSNASKEESKKTQHAATPRKQKTDSKTEHEQDAGPRVDRKANHSSPNSRIKHQGLAFEHQRKKQKQNKQTTKRASNTRKLSKHNKHFTKTTQRKTKARPRREKGERVDQPKVGKEIPTAPLRPTSHPPDPRRSREGRAISKRGVGGIPFHFPRGQDRTRSRQGKTKKKTIQTRGRRC